MQFVEAATAYEQFHWLTQHAVELDMTWRDYVTHDNRLRAFLSRRVTFINCNGKFVLVNKEAVSLLQHDREFRDDFHRHCFPKPAAERRAHPERHSQ